MASMADYGRGRPLIVVAIDFGTTYSGYAFSFRDKPLDVKTNQVWNAGSAQFLSLKTPTCVLLDPRQEFVAFGFDAENQYASLAEEKRHKDWYLFRRFKMVLYENKDISAWTRVTDIRGRQVEALLIFSHAIRYMADHCRKTLNDQMSGVADTDIQYVLTVPAIWNDKAKQFMRKAATLADIPGSQLIIALEPEAASIWGQVVMEDQTLNDIDSQYIVTDIGGGTADITAHQKMVDGTLTELHRASGGPWGGTLVDEQYLAFLECLLGRDVMRQFVDTETSDYIDLLREFETKKRTVTPERKGKVIFRLPASLRNLCETERQHSLKELVEISQYSSEVIVSGEKLRVDMAIVQEFFTPAINGLIFRLREMLQKPVLRDISMILIVGGFGECPLLQDAIKKEFPHLECITPQEASLTVLKGAVRFGHMRDIVCCRKSKYAYGIIGSAKFDERVHPPDKKFVQYDRAWCLDLFDKVVEVGEELYLGMEVKRERFVTHACETKTVVSVYCSECNETRFVDDPGCYLLGQFTVQLPESDILDDKTFTVSLLFWDTEIRVIVKIHRTDEEYETVVDCL